MFRSTDSGQNGQRINNGLLGLYESALAINRMVTFFQELTLSATGGVYRSSNYADSLAINPSELSSPEQRNAEQVCIALPTRVTVGRLPT